MGARLLVLSIVVLGGCRAREAPHLIERSSTEHLAAAFEEIGEPSLVGVARDSTTPHEESAAEPPTGYARVVVGVKSNQDHDAIVVLTDPKNGRILPLFFSASDGAAIAKRVARQRKTELPTDDLLDVTLRALGGRVVRVQLDELAHGQFKGTVILHTGDRTVSLEARAADALAMAMGNGAPFYVAEKLLDDGEDDEDVATAGNLGMGQPLPL